MPAIVAKSIAILSDAGLGMAMFSLGTLDNSVRLEFCFKHVALVCLSTETLSKMELQVYLWPCSLESLLVASLLLLSQWVFVS